MVPSQAELPSPGWGKKGLAPGERTGILPTWKWAKFPSASAYMTLKL